MKKRVLITGAGGFIAAALLQELGRDCQIWAVSKSGRVSVPADGQLLEIDLALPGASAQLRAALPQHPFDAVLHLAALTPRSGAIEMERCFAVNAFATRYLLDGLPVAPSPLVDQIASAYNEMLAREQS